MIVSRHFGIVNRQDSITSSFACLDSLPGYRMLSVDTSAWLVSKTNGGSHSKSLAMSSRFYAEKRCMYDQEQESMIRTGGWSACSTIVLRVS